MKLHRSTKKIRTYELRSVLFIACLFFLLLNGRFQDSSQKDIPRKISDSNFIEELLKAEPEKFQSVFQNSGEYKVQIIYTQIDRDKKNIPHFTQYNFHLDPATYFYPASMVKLPAAALALEKINSLREKGVDKFSRLKIDSAWKCQTKMEFDSTAENGYPSVAHFIKRMLLTSDDEAYNRMFSFVGMEFLNRRMQEMGYANTRITHSFDVNCLGELARHTNPFIFYDKSGKEIYRQPMLVCEKKYPPPFGEIKIGKGYLDSKNKLVNQPKDFTYLNCMTLQEVHDMLLSVIFPASVPEDKRFKLTGDDYSFLRKYLSMYPRESDFPKYDSKKYWDSYKKYFLYGDSKDSITNKNIRIFNIVGQSHGFLSDAAYIVDFENKTEFMLAATIYVNSDGILNDGKYEYNEIGFPFLANLGRTIYEYEKKRKRENIPDLSEFQLKY
ncbi:MAG: serine hydrolase [Bacteroidetes bacterium]|nr:serine hydrolase [Bacteroidota bacterium]